MRREGWDGEVEIRSFSWTETLRRGIDGIPRHGHIEPDVSFVFREVCGFRVVVVDVSCACGRFPEVFPSCALRSRLLGCRGVSLLRLSRLSFLYGFLLLVLTCTKTNQLCVCFFAQSHPMTLRESTFRTLDIVHCFLLSDKRAFCESVEIRKRVVGERFYSSWGLVTLKNIDSYLV
jgi:hypothetical protein